MRKGYLLIEMLVVIFVIAMLSVPLAMLAKTTLSDIPRSFRVTESNGVIYYVLKMIEKDTNSAKGFPQSIGSYTAGDDTLLITKSDSTICYQLGAGHITRHTLIDGNDTSFSWLIPKGVIRWNILERNNQPYALQLQTHVEKARNKGVEKKMAGSHIYFVDTYPEEIN